jgi:hypothetical protein
MEVKGSVVSLFPIFLRERFGAAGYELWFRSLPKASRAVFEVPVMPTSWYPLSEALVQPTDAICRLFFQGDLIGARECGRFSASEGLSGTYDFFIRWGSPEVVIRKSAQILPTFYRPSAVEVGRMEKKGGIVRTTEFPESHPIIEARVAGWMERALEMSGCRGIHVGIISSIARGDAHTDYHCTWL